MIETVLSAGETCAVCLKEDNRAIGSIGRMIGKISTLDLPEHEREIGYRIGVPFWGRGLIPKAVRARIRHAFTDLRPETLWCGYFDSSEKSRRCRKAERSLLSKVQRITKKRKEAFAARKPW